jgi:4-hydroxymandelate oxidase
VSNHGGRQLDGAPATLDALPEVVEAAEGRTEILIDGGVRRGSDVFKALALGARAVMVGRPYLWGLAVDGADGVRRILEILRDDLILTMALAGRVRVADIDRSAVAPAPLARERGDQT